MKEIKAIKLTKENFSELTGEETVKEIISRFKDSKQVFVIINNGKYVGVLTQKEVIKATSDTKIKKIVRNAPKITKNTSLQEIARLMCENQLHSLPVFEGEVVVGIVHGDDVIEQLFYLIEEKHLAEDIMTENMITLSSEDTIASALVTLRENNISRIPLVKEGEFIGIVSLKDVVTKAIKPTEKLRKDILDERKTPLNLKINEIMVKNLITCSAKEGIRDVYNIMKKNDVSSVLVENRGIITKRDLLSHLTSHFSPEKEVFKIQIISKIRLNREKIRKELQTFLEKYKDLLKQGHIYVHITEHKETLRGEKLLHCRLRVRAAKKFDLTAEGFGESQTIGEALRKLRVLIIKSDEKQSAHRDIIDYIGLE